MAVVSLEAAWIFPWRPLARPLHRAVKPRCLIWFEMTAPFLSVLLPTRNRLDLLKAALATVLRQDDGDFEVIVSDNASSDDVMGFVVGLGDVRVRCLRSDVPLPVTDNWNRAVDAASGQYVVMLGDDDGLVPGYVAAMREAVLQLRDPDFVYHGAFHFAHPGTIPGKLEGYVVDVTAMHSVLDGADATPQLLDTNVARAAGRAAVDMRALYGFNMQYFLFRRGFLDTLRRFGPVFRGPYPDFYTANLAMLLAERPAVLRRPMTMIGITPKSYGFFHFNRREGEGVEFLVNAGFDRAVAPELARKLLPGSAMDAQWLASVALVRDALARDTPLRLGIERYRWLQVLKALLDPFVDGTPPGEAWHALRPLLRGWEWARAVALAMTLSVRRRLPLQQRQAIAQRLLAGPQQYGDMTGRAPVDMGITGHSVVEVFDALAARQ